MSVSPCALKRPFPVTKDEYNNVMSSPIKFEQTLLNPLPSQTVEGCSPSDIPPSSGLTRPSPTPSLPSVNGDHATTNASDNAAGQPPAKRRKLTAEEKEAKKREQDEKREAREAKAAVRAVEKAKKDEEKQAKEQERKVKEEERELKKRKREEEKEAKESEKRKKEEEKEKKDKAQLKLNAWFAKPKETDKNEEPILPHENGETFLNSAASSPTKTPGDRPSRPASESPIKKPTLSDYQRSFPPFFVKSHVTVAPTNRFRKKLDNLQSCQVRMDQSMERTSDSMDIDSTETARKSLFRKRRRNIRHIHTKDVIAALHGSALAPIDLTEETSVKNPTDLLKLLTIKYLKFWEDVRPPYRGTFTKLPPEGSALRLGRNPFQRALPEIDYDYDSEAEWEEPEEGEDLVSEGEEEGSEDGGADDMDGFLDDEEIDEHSTIPGSKRRVIVGELEPVCSGLCWEDEKGALGMADSKVNFEDFKLETFLENPQAPIDPYSDSYWETATMPPPATTGSHLPGSITSFMNPPRIPLNAINRPNAGVNSQLPVSTEPGAKIKRPVGRPKTKTADDRIPETDMQRFRDEVEGSDLTKTGLIEVLKKKFPNSSKDAIKNTLTAVAVRSGAKEVEKRWKLVV